MRPLEAPDVMAVGPQGWVYLSDGGSRIRVYTPQGRFIAEWGGHGTGPNEFQAITGLAVDGSGAVYAADPENQRVHRLALVEQPRHLALLPVAIWGRFGSGHGEFNRPVAVAVDRDARHLYVADHRNHRIEAFDLDGRWLATIGGPVVCKQPGSLAVDPLTGGCSSGTAAAAG
jgi:sugar lactone lactonase YvrE